jgi:hypothetical protein
MGRIKGEERKLGQKTWSKIFWGFRLLGMCGTSKVDGDVENIDD